MEASSGARSPSSSPRSRRSRSPTETAAGKPQHASATPLNTSDDGALTVAQRHSDEGDTPMSTAPYASPTTTQPRGEPSNPTAAVVAILLGILVAVLGFFALLMWVDAHKARD